MKVNDLIDRKMITADPFETKSEIEKLMDSCEVHALPVLSEDGSPIGLITSSDLQSDLPGETPASDLMSDRVYTVDVWEDAAEAARMMRDFHVHHLVATDNDEASGVLSSFDLLTLVEDEEE